MHTHRHSRCHHIAVGVVLVLVAERIVPIVENLTTENMSAHAPGVLPATLAQYALAHTNRICINHLVGAVAVERQHALRQRQRVMISRRVAQIEPHEGNRRRAIGKHLHIAWNEPEVLRIPGACRLKLPYFEHRVAQPYDVRRRYRWALRLVDAGARLAVIERQWSSVSEIVDLAATEHSIYPKS